MKNNVTVTGIKVYPFENSKSKVKAFAQIVLNNALRLGGLKLIKGENGMFVSYPAEQSKDGKYYNVYNPVTREIRNKIQDAVIDNYNRSLSLTNA